MRQQNGVRQNKITYTKPNLLLKDDTNNLTSI